MTLLYIINKTSKKSEVSFVLSVKSNSKFVYGKKYCFRLSWINKVINFSEEKNSFLKYLLFTNQLLKKSKKFSLKVTLMTNKKTIQSKIL